MKKFKMLFLILMSSLLIGCSNAPKKSAEVDKNFMETTVQEDKDILFGKSDYFSPMNRRIYAFNSFADREVLAPTLRTYDYYTPNFVQDRIKNFFSNFGDIKTAGNLLLQFRIPETLETIFRFGINSSIGLLGTFDVASKMGFPKYKETLGNTFAYYGVPSGPYIVAPLLGPSNFRDLVGLGIESYGLSELDPYDDIHIDVGSIWFTSLFGLQTKKNAGIYFGETDFIFEYEYMQYLSKKLTEYNLNKAKNTRKNIL